MGAEVTWQGEAHLFPGSCAQEPHQDWLRPYTLKHSVMSQVGGNSSEGFAWRFHYSLQKQLTKTASGLLFPIT